MDYFYLHESILLDEKQIVGHEVCNCKINLWKPDNNIDCTMYCLHNNLPSESMSSKIT